jgi:hypothetical protein
MAFGASVTHDFYRRYQDTYVCVHSNVDHPKLTRSEHARSLEGKLEENVNVHAAVATNSPQSRMHKVKTTLLGYFMQYKQ